MFVLKEGSRNAMNNDRGEELSTENYFKLWGKRLPHMDAVDDVLKVFDNSELEKLKAGLVATLIEKKVFSKYRLLDVYYRIAVDATGVMIVSEGHCDYCLKRQSKNGVVTFFHNVLEAKPEVRAGCVSSACPDLWRGDQRWSFLLRLTS